MLRSIPDIEQRALWYAWSIKISWWIDRVRYFLDLLWNPQLTFNVIHVAGTSGKWTTCRMISNCLYSLWHHVWLTMSPHISDVRERCMVDNQIIEKTAYIKYMNIIKTTIDNNDRSQIGQPSYFEIMIVAALYIFGQEWVQYAVLETWLGGRLDATNVIDWPDKICVITSIGYDHQKFLWDTLESIAREKALIVHVSNQCFTYPQDDDIIDHTISDVISKQWWYLRTNELIDLPLPSHFVWHHNQIDANLSYQTVKYLLDRDNIFWSEDNIEDALLSCPSLVARMQNIVIESNTFIVDWSHNTQKISALLQWLWELYNYDQKYVFILAFKQDKQVEKVIKLIMPYASHIICTEFGKTEQDYPLMPVAATAIQQICLNLWYNNTSVELDHQSIINHCRKKTNNKIVVSGSFYLASSFIELLSDEI